MGLLQKIKELLVSSIEALTNRVKASNDKQLYIRSEFARNNRNKIAYDFMYAMSFDLYEVFKDKSYPKLAAITQPSDIRILDYKEDSSGTLYYFKMQKKSEESIARTFYGAIKDNMNNDIYRITQDVLHAEGIEVLRLKNPFLYAGIYIYDVQEINAAEVVITVVTNFFK